MSFSKSEARFQRLTETQKALDDQNAEELVRLAKLYKKEGEDEMAATMLDLAGAINRRKELDDWDAQGKEAGAQRKEREDEQREMDQLPAEGPNN